MGLCKIVTTTRARRRRTAASDGCTLNLTALVSAQRTHSVLARSVWSILALDFPLPVADSADARVDNSIKGEETGPDGLQSVPTPSSPLAKCQSRRTVRPWGRLAPNRPVTLVRAATVGPEEAPEGPRPRPPPPWGVCCGRQPASWPATMLRGVDGSRPNRNVKKVSYKTSKTPFYCTFKLK